MNTKRHDPRPAGTTPLVHKSVDRGCIWIDPAKALAYADRHNLTAEQVGEMMFSITEALKNGEHVDFPFICLSDPEGK